jgi:putative endonuclease
MVIDLRQHLGRVGERLAREHLERLGYRVVAGNYRTRFGELDLIVCDATWLVEAIDRPRSRELRFDVVAVTVDRDGRLVRLDHLEGAF